MYMYAQCKKNKTSIGKKFKTILKISLACEGLAFLYESANPYPYKYQET